MNENYPLLGTRVIECYRSFVDNCIANISESELFRVTVVIRVDRYKTVITGCCTQFIVFVVIHDSFTHENVVVVKRFFHSLKCAGRANCIVEPPRLRRPPYLHRDLFVVDKC